MSDKAKIGEVICKKLIELTDKNTNLLAITSDSRGSAALTPFAEEKPNNLIEMGIAEQNAVTVAAGLAHSGKRPFVFSPAAFLTMRSIEQVKDDVAYSNTNVKLIGISGGNSYSYLGATHHSLQDLAITRAIPNLEVYMPTDQYQTKSLMKYLATSDKPAYVRIGKMALPNIYQDENQAFSSPGHANIVINNGTDATIITMGETLFIAKKAAQLLKKQGIHIQVIDLVSLKPLDYKLLNQIADNTKMVITLEEHSIYGGLGSAVAETLSSRGDTKLHIMGFPDEPIIAGTQDEVFAYYEMDAESISKKITQWIRP